MVTFIANTKSLQALFKQLKVGLGKLNPKTKAFACEITVIDDTVVFNLPGFQNSISCATEGTVKVTTSFLRLFDIIKNETKKEMFFQIGEEEMTIGILTLAVHTCYFKNDRILRSINMPINFKDIDLLRLQKQGYTFEELQFNKLINPITEAENNLKYNINYSYNRLKEYGVSYEELEKLVKTNI
jgi:hypothetical protein